MLLSYIQLLYIHFVSFNLSILHLFDQSNNTQFNVCYQPSSQQKQCSILEIKYTLKFYMKIYNYLLLQALMHLYQHTSIISVREITSQLLVAENYSLLVWVCIVFYFF